MFYALHMHEKKLCLNFYQNYRKNAIFTSCVNCVNFTLIRQCVYVVLAPRRAKIDEIRLALCFSLASGHYTDKQS